MLSRALIADARRCGADIRIVRENERPWSSATFTGARHGYEVEMLADDAARRWIASLTEAELPITGHLVADLAVTRSSWNTDGGRASIEALTVEES